MKGLLECFRTAPKIGVTGELGVDIANGKVANGKRFKAKVIYNNVLVIQNGKIVIVVIL